MNTPTVKIRDLELGAGLPKVILPIAESRDSAVYSQAREFRARPTDIVEWRADYYSGIRDTASVMTVLKKLRKLLGKLPLIFTCRRKEFGGMADMDAASARKLYQAVIESGLVDALDLELGTDPAQLRELIELAHQKSVVVIGSYDNNEAALSVEETVKCVRELQAYPVDAIKVAFMAETPADAVHLMDATQILAQDMDRPLITIAMGTAGMITRIACEAVGSCATYGSVGEGTAPGQFPVERLQSMIKILHQGMAK